MNQTLSEHLYHHTGDESSAPQSPSRNSKPKSSGSSKAGDKHTKKEKSSTETPEEKEKRKSEQKDKKDRKKDKEESKEKESKSKDSTETPEEKTQRRKEKKDKKEKKENKEDNKNLKRTIKTLRRRVEEVESKNRLLSEENGAMQDLETKLNQAEEQLEYATEENLEFSTRVHALEHALVEQETELDNALTLILHNDQARQEHDLLDAGKTTNPFFSILKELKAVRGELEQLKQEHGTAVDKATKVSIQLAELKAETDESRGQLTESHALVAIGISKLGSSVSGLPISIGMSKLGSALWRFSNKDDDKSVVANYEDDCTEDNTSESSEDDFTEQHSVAFC
jgi:hypothetical protein